MVTTLTQRLIAAPAEPVKLTLSLTAEERTRSRHRFETADGESILLQLPRGTVLRDGDWLRSETDGVIVRVIAKPEPVLTVTADNPLALLKAVYHLGNRHVSLEITQNYLRLSPDPVLREMLEYRGLHIVEDIQPFQPELGAYEHGH